jgi:hypothetical protein
MKFFRALARRIHVKRWNNDLRGPLRGFRVISAPDPLTNLLIASVLSNPYIETQKDQSTY